MKIVLAGVEYRTKKAALEVCREILNSYQPGETVSDGHREILLDLFGYHTEWESKCGCGVQSIQVERNIFTSGFWIIRVDGSRTDISYIKSLSPPSHESQVRAGFRSAIIQQILDFRAAAFSKSETIQCAVTGDLIQRENSHADHQVTFKQLVDDFMANRGLHMEQIEILPTKDGKLLTRLMDEKLVADWAEYHKKHAVLRMVKASVNLGLLRRSPT